MQISGTMTRDNGAVYSLAGMASPVVGDGQWHDRSINGEPFLEFASTGPISRAVYAAHQYGGNRGSVQSWGLHGNPGAVLVAGDFGGPDQVHPTNFDRVKWVIDDVRSRFGDVPFCVAGVSGGGRIAMGMPGRFPGLVQACVSQLGIFNVPWFREDTAARGDNGTVNQLDNDCGGPPPNATYDACSPSHYVSAVRDLKAWVDMRTGDDVVTPRHSQAFIDAITGLPGVQVTVRSQTGGHVPDYSWLRSAVEAALQA